MEVYKTFINTMNDRIVDRATNPFKFKHISDISSEADLSQRIGPCVVIASPGMLQNGTSRILFDMWCSDPKNGVIFTGYSVENTHARNVLKNPQFVKTLNEASVPLRMSISNISFSAHSDFEGTSTFIDILDPAHIVLVHGERNEMSRLMEALNKRYDGLSHTIYKPENCSSVNIPVPFNKIVKVRFFFFVLIFFFFMIIKECETDKGGEDGGQDVREGSDGDVLRIDRTESPQVLCVLLRRDE